MMDIQTSVRTETIHTVTVIAPDGAPFVMGDMGDGMAVESVEVKFFVIGRALAPVGTHFVARGRSMRADGTVARSRRVEQGTNLRRLPLMLALAAQEELRESVGSMEDPTGQFVA